MVLKHFTPPLADVHAHICDERFDTDRAEVLRKAAQISIRAIVAVGENRSDARKNLDLAKKFSILKPAAGLYPTYLDLDLAAEMTAFIRQHHMNLVGIGEVGLDYWAVKNEPGKALQREIFGKFINLSNELNLPLNVHSRSAGRQAVRMLMEHNARHVQLHAFDGKAGNAMPAVEAGYFFSIPPSVVRSRQKQKLVKQLPLDCLLVESDSPVLGPDPHQRNEPANLPVAAQAIAEIKAISPQSVAEAVFQNTQRLYGKKLFQE